MPPIDPNYWKRRKHINLSEAGAALLPEARRIIAGLLPPGGKRLPDTQVVERALRYVIEGGGREAKGDGDPPTEDHDRTSNRTGRSPRHDKGAQSRFSKMPLRSTPVGA